MIWLLKCFLFILYSSATFVHVLVPFQVVEDICLEMLSFSASSKQLVTKPKNERKLII